MFRAAQEEGGWDPWYMQPRFKLVVFAAVVPLAVVVLREEPSASDWRVWMLCLALGFLRGTAFMRHGPVEDSPPNLPPPSRDELNARTLKIAGELAELRTQFEEIKRRKGHDAP